ncbi:MAG: hypothetical protein WD690_18990 [Vicinamibacterales bacterium]
METLGAVYLGCVYVAVRMTATPDLLDRFGAWFGYSAAIAAALGIGGAIVSWMDSPTRLATVVLTPIPYLGHAPRAQAFTAGPQMLASILLMAVPLFVGSRMGRSWRPRDVVCVGLLVLGLIATVSKTALCLAAALTVMWAVGQRTGNSVPSGRSRIRPWTAALVSLGAALIMTIGSHVMVMPRAAVANMIAVQLVAGRPAASFQWNQDPWVVMPTTYTHNNRASLRAIVHSWPIGVGPAGQPAFATALQREGRYPWSITLTTPHSTYLGTVAQLGAAGLVALVLLLTAAGLTIRRLLAGPPRFRWEAAAYAGVSIGFLIEAISTDLLNCRHYWILLAVMTARMQAISTESEGRMGIRMMPD